jgi:hypothetical protein
MITARIPSAIVMESTLELKDFRCRWARGALSSEGPAAAYVEAERHHAK